MYVWLRKKTEPVAINEDTEDEWFIKDEKYVLTNHQTVNHSGDFNEKNPVLHLMGDYGILDVLFRVETGLYSQTIMLPFRDSNQLVREVRAKLSKLEAAVNEFIANVLKSENVDKNTS